MTTFETTTAYGANLKADAHITGVGDYVAFLISDKSNGASCRLGKKKLGMLLAFLQQAYKSMK